MREGERERVGVGDEGDGKREKEREWQNGGTRYLRAVSSFALYKLKILFRICKVMYNNYTVNCYHYLLALI